MTLVIITIDTEEDGWDDYRAPPTTNNIQVLPRFQNLCDQYGALPTYLINYPVATQPEARSIIEKLLAGGKCEVGAHCHPWNTPPIKENICDKNTMLTNLEDELVRDKLFHLHNTIETNFGIQLTSFRSGRWGGSNSVMRVLEELNYEVDSSVAPLMNWTSQYGPDYTDALTSHYLFSSDDFLKEDHSGKLAQIPPSIGFLKNNTPWNRKIFKEINKPFYKKIKLNGIANRLGLVSLRWLSPELSSTKEMIMLSKSLVSSGFPYLHMMFHSTTLQPGNNEYVKSEQELDIFFSKIEAFFQYCSENDMEFTTLSASRPLLINE